MRGTVYIVESLSEDPNIVALKGRLYKIGFTTLPRSPSKSGSKKTRPSCAPRLNSVRPTKRISAPRKLEQLLHQFLAHANLQVEVVLGRPVVPKEWFVVPLDLVEEAVTRILDRSIIKFRHDAISRKILAR